MTLSHSAPDAAWRARLAEQAGKLVLGKLLPMGLLMWVPAEEERIGLVSPSQTCEGDCIRVFQDLT